MSWEEYCKSVKEAGYDVGECDKCHKGRLKVAHLITRGFPIPFYKCDSCGWEV